MTHYSHVISIATHGRALVEFTDTVCDWVKTHNISTGLLTLYCQHTSASLLIQENAAPEVQTDLIAAFDTLVPEGTHYLHDSEGPDDMPAHIKSALTHTHLSIPVINARLALGTWQGIYLWEHRQHAHRRRITVTVYGG